MKKILLLAAILIVAACQPSAPPITKEDVSDKAFDILLTGGTVVDGLGTPRYQADVGINGDRIVAISTDGLSADDAVVSINVATLVISPGFIDNHAHIQTTIHEHPLAENFTRQGITTIIAGLHSGDQPWPLDDYASSLEVAPNVGFFAGHTWTRKQVLGLENRAPDHDELQAMRDLVEETMQQGALGLSTGLLYVPANFAESRLHN